MDENINNSRVIEKNLQYLMQNHGEIYEAYKAYGSLVHEKGGPLEEKTRWLIKVSLSADCQNPYSLKTHIKKALSSGCTPEEIEHAILLVGPTCGFPKMMNALLIFRQIVEGTEAESAKGDQ